MATMPSRIPSLIAMVPGILEQCDELHIYLNEFDQEDVPDILFQPKIRLYHSNQWSGNLGSSGKFYTCDEHEGYIFTIDDDFFYPVDYARRMIDTIEKYKRKAFVFAHGRRVINRPCPSYFREKGAFFQCTQSVAQDEFIHIGGTGVMAYHSDTVAMDLEIFKRKNMCDLFVGKWLNDLGIPRVVLKHPEAWLRLTGLTDPNQTISRLVRNDDTIYTQFINEVDWQLHAESFA